MKLLVDENLSGVVADVLRDSGYDCIYVYDVNLNGAKDVEVLEFARQNLYVIITMDKGDFTYTLATTHAKDPSVILIRQPLSDEPPDVQAQTLLEMLEPNTQVLEQGAIISLHSKEKIRVRNLPIE